MNVDRFLTLLAVVLVILCALVYLNIVHIGGH